MVEIYINYKASCWGISAVFGMYIEGRARQITPCLLGLHLDVRNTNKRSLNFINFLGIDVVNSIQGKPLKAGDDSVNGSNDSDHYSTHGAYVRWAGEPGANPATEPTHWPLTFLLIVGIGIGVVLVAISVCCLGAGLSAHWGGDRHAAWGLLILMLLLWGVGEALLHLDTVIHHLS